MNQLNEDKKVLEGRRTKKLGSAALASKRDQIPEKLRQILIKKKVGQKVSEMWSQGNAERTTWLNRQQVYLRDIDEFLESSAEGAFAGSSTLHLPISLTIAKGMHARFVRAMLGIEPYFNTKARREDSIKAAEAVQSLMHYALKDWVNNHDGIADIIDAWLWQWITVGSGILKWRWEEDWTSWWDVKYDGEVEREEYVTKRTFQGPKCEVKKHEDVLIIGGEGDPNKADAVLDRYWVNASDLWTAVDRAIFDEKAIRKIIKGGNDRIQGSVSSDIKEQRARQGGMNSAQKEKELDSYEIVEAYLKMDVDGSGINSDVVVWVHLRTNEIVRATYLRRINKAGKLPYQKIDFHRRSGSDYGIGLVEMLYPLAKEMDAIHNIHVDNNLLATMPFFFYRPSSNMPEQDLELEPGLGIPLDNPQTDVHIPNLGNRLAFGVQQEQSIQNLVERLTGINDMSLGVLSGAQGATRTATGARALLSEQSTSLDVFLRRMHRGWRQALEYLLNMLQQRIPDGFSFRVTGEDGNDYWGEVKGKDDIAGNLEFELNPNSESSNPDIQKEVASEVLQLTLNPLLIQTQVVSTGNIWEAVKNYLKSRGVKDFAKFVTKPPNYQHTLTPQDEANRILRGQEVPVTPEMDHQGFIAYFAMVMKSDEILGQFSEDKAIALAKQAEQHKQMMKALQNAQAQTQNVQQTEINARGGGGNQAPVGANVFGGGQG